MNPLAPKRLTRWLIGVPVALLLLIPLVSLLIFTFRDHDGFTLSHWAGLFDPASAALLKPIWVGLGNSLILAIVTVAIIMILVVPTMILVALRFPRMRRLFEFVALLPVSVPAIVLVVGLAPIYLQIGRTLGTGAWTLAFAYGITVLPYAYRSIQASLDAVDVRTLAEAGRTLGAGWITVTLRVLAPNLRPGLLAASLISVAVVLGEFTIASLLNRQVFQTAILVISKADAYSAAMFALIALVFAFALLLIIGRAGRPAAERKHS